MECEQLSKDDILCTISMNGVEIGRGRERNKNLAKRSAATAALHALLPGIVLDPATGFVIELPDGNLQGEELTRKAEAASLEDLAPNLAKRLAIGQNDADRGDPGSEWQAKPTTKTKRTLGTYPASSTTSEEELDANAYYLSRGANLCSELLFAMIQIDPHLKGPPLFSYEHATLPLSEKGDVSASNSEEKSKDVSGEKNSKFARANQSRMPFSCTARLRKTPKFDVLGEDGEIDSSESLQKSQESEEILEATGVGGSKREARHVASAKLLALLFPDCESMVEVKAAAETAREVHARRHVSVPSTYLSAMDRKRSSDAEVNTGALGRFLTAQEDDPPLPVELQDEFCALLGLVEDDDSRTQYSSGVGVDPKEAYSGAETPISSVSRRVSRQKQIDERVDAALQIVNEHDDEGRSLPEELTVDDVGRTVLRRALPDDLGFIKKLLVLRSRDDSASKSSPRTEMGARFSDGESNNLDLSYLWTESSIVLLLCRAIASNEDPPLGCAILSLSFSMERGRLLEIVKLASEMHLPKERFVECLQDFAAAMKCSLDQRPSKPAGMLLSETDLKTIAESHFLPAGERRKDLPPSNFRNTIGCRRRGAGGYSMTSKRVSSPLQSVQEESEEVSESSVEATRPASSIPSKRSSKPSKRSRFA